MISRESVENIWGISRGNQEGYSWNLVMIFKKSVENIQGIRREYPENQ